MIPYTERDWHSEDFGCGHPRTHLANDCEKLRELRERFNVTGQQIVDLEDRIAAGSNWDAQVTYAERIAPIVEWMERRLTERRDLYRQIPIGGDPA